MSVRASKAVWEHATGVTFAQRVLLLKIADHADDHGVGWPAIGSEDKPGELVGQTGFDRRRAQRELRAVEASGVVKSVPVGKGPRCQPYLVLQLPGLDGDMSGAIERRGMVPLDDEAKGGTRAAYNEEGQESVKGGKSVRLRAANRFNKGGTRAARTVREPSDGTTSTKTVVSSEEPTTPSSGASASSGKSSATPPLTQPFSSTPCSPPSPFPGEARDLRAVDVEAIAQEFDLEVEGE
ncbi:MAG: hypothetical protein ACRDMH_03245 [Solirubrobacterales bacterium]